VSLMTPDLWYNKGDNETIKTLKRYFPEMEEELVEESKNGLSKEELTKRLNSFSKKSDVFGSPEQKEKIRKDKEKKRKSKFKLMERRSIYTMAEDLSEEVVNLVKSKGLKLFNESEFKKKIERTIHEGVSKEPVPVSFSPERDKEEMRAAFGGGFGLKDDRIKWHGEDDAITN
jgi:hypothetical protein